MIRLAFEVLSGINRGCLDTDLDYDKCRSYIEADVTNCSLQCIPIMFANCEEYCVNGTCRRHYDSIEYICDPISEKEAEMTCLEECPISKICLQNVDKFVCATCGNGMVANRERDECVSAQSYFGCVGQIEEIDDYSYQIQAFCKFIEQINEYQVTLCDAHFVHSSNFSHCIGRETKEGCLVIIEGKEKEYCKQLSSQIFVVSDCPIDEFQLSTGLGCLYATELQLCEWKCNNPLSYCKYDRINGTLSEYICAPCPSEFISAEDKTTCVPINSSSGCYELCKNGVCELETADSANELEEFYKCNMCQSFEVYFNGKCQYKYSLAVCVYEAQISVNRICVSIAAMSGTAYEGVECPETFIANKEYNACQSKIDYCRAECYATAVYCKVSAENPRGYTCIECPHGYRNSDDRTYCIFIDEKDPNQQRDLWIIIIILCVVLSVTLIVVFALGIIKYVEYKERISIVREEERGREMTNTKTDRSQLELQREQLTREYLDELGKLMVQNQLD